MAKKYEIIGNDLYITDTVSGAVEFQEAAKECSFINKELLNGEIEITYPLVSNESSSIKFRSTIGDESIDSTLTPFTEATFRTFCSTNLGGSGTGESGGGAESNAVSTLNSTITPLVSAASFEGSWEDVSLYDSVIVAVKTDQNGLYRVEFSPDGINLDSSLTRYYRTDQIEAPHRFTITRSYARVSFTNESLSDQTFIRLQTTYGTKSDLNAPLDSVLAQDFDALAVRGSDYHSEVSLGLRQGVTSWNKFGYNDDIDDTGDEEIIASWGGVFEFITVGETIDISSTSVNDTLLGTGAQKIVITGIDEDWNEQVEVVDMNGTTTVTTSSQWIGINRIAIFKSGTGLKNAGTINIKANTSTYTMAQMPTGNSTTQQCLFYVPADHNFLTQWIHFNSIKISGGGGQPEVTFKIHVYSDVSTSVYEIFRNSLDVADTGTLTISPPIPFLVSEKSIIWLTAESDTNNTAVRGRFSGELHRNVSA